FFGEWDRLRQEDGELIKAFESADKRFGEIARDAVKAVYASKELSDEQRRQLQGMKNNLTVIQATVRKKSFLPAEYKRVQAAQEQCRKTFDTICKESGMGTGFIDLMLETVLSEAGINIVRRRR